MLRLHNEPHKLSLMLHRTVHAKMLRRVCQSRYVPQGKWCLKQTLYHKVIFGISIGILEVHYMCTYALLAPSVLTPACARGKTVQRKGHSQTVWEIFYINVCVCVCVCVFLLHKAVGLGV